MFGNLVSLRANLQSIVALSTTEAEYIVASEALKEALWLRGLVSKLLQVKEPKITVVHYDSQSAMSLNKNQVYHNKTKHVNVKYHFIQDMINSKAIAIKKISTSENVANMLTKVLPYEKFNYCLVEYYFSN